jgi:hypothetical protein
MIPSEVIACRCGEIVVKSLNGTTKVRSKILLFREGKAIAICKGCGAEMSVPLLIDEESTLLKSRPTRLFIRDNKSLKGRTKGSKTS